MTSVFGVEPSYLLDRGEPVFDEELVEAVRDEAARKMALETSRLPERERRLMLGIVRQFVAAERPALPRTQGSRLIEKLLPANRTSATHTSFASGISASSSAQSTKQLPVYFKIFVAEDGAQRVGLATT